MTTYIIDDVLTNSTTEAGFYAEFESEITHIGERVNSASVQCRKKWFPHFYSLIILFSDFWD